MLYASVATLLTDVFHVDHVTGKRPRFCPCASRSDGNSHLCEIRWDDLDEYSRMYIFCIPEYTRPYSFIEIWINIDYKLTILGKYEL